MDKKGEVVIMQAFMDPLRQYVTMDVSILDTGEMVPRAFTMEGGKKYTIDEVISVHFIKKEEPGPIPKKNPTPWMNPAAVPTRANICELPTCDEYRVRIHGREARIYFEPWPHTTGQFCGRWFVINTSPSCQSKTEKNAKSPWGGYQPHTPEADK